MSAQRLPPGPQPPPAVQRLRLRYAKRGRMRFCSTRDFQRALERALRRATIPMAYSAGFHPHPKISYANAAPTGAASEAEYVELALAEQIDPDTLCHRLTEALPEGLDVLEAVEAAPGSLADRLEGSEWSLEFPGEDHDRLRAACEAFLRMHTCEVTRVFKNGPRTFDARAAVLVMDVWEDPDRSCVILRLVVRHATPSVRPDDVLTALRDRVAFVTRTPPLITRLAQGPLGATGVGDPLAIDRDVTGR